MLLCFTIVSEAVYGILGVFISSYFTFVGSHVCRVYPPPAFLLNTPLLLRNYSFLPPLPTFTSPDFDYHRDKTFLCLKSGINKHLQL